MATDEVLYEPIHAGIADLLAQLQCQSVLIIDEPAEDLIEQLQEHVSDLRFTPEPLAIRKANRMPPGLYASKDRGWWRAVVVQGPRADAVQPRRDRLAHIYDDGDPLVLGTELAGLWWSDAVSIGSELAWPAGTHVLIEGTSDFGIVVSHRRLSDALQYTVAVSGVHKTVTSTALKPLPGDLNDPHTWISLPHAGAEEIGLTLAWTKLHHPLTDVLYSFHSSKTLFRPYQFKPVLKIIQGESHRLLIADEVGLGKTIEAGLIWSELEGRNPLDRVLILCPAALLVKWQTEMSLRFDRRLDLLGKTNWEQFFERIDKGEYAPLMGVDSIERLRLTNVPERLVETGARFDLVIMDEAHKMRNPKNQTHQLGESLADASDALVLLTATPVNLGNRDLYTLLELLDDARFNDFTTFGMESEPNTIVNEAASILLDPRSTPRDVWKRLQDLRLDPVGLSIIDRPDCLDLLALLDTAEPLSARDVDRAKRLLAGLGTLFDVHHEDAQGRRARCQGHTLAVPAAS